jgi:Ribonuclease G/E
MMHLENGIYLHNQGSALCLSHIEADRLIEAMYISAGIQPGDVLVGRIVHKISPSQYFVEIGLNKPALLQKPLQDYREGDKILAQVKRLMIPEGDFIKNAEITDRLSFSSPHLRFAPSGHDVVIAGAIQDKAWRQEAKLYLEAQLAQFSYGSVIVYKEAYKASYETLATELTDLKKLYEALLKHDPQAKPGTTLKAALPPYVTYVLQHDNVPVFIADAALAQRLEAYGVPQSRIAFDPRCRFIEPLKTLWAESLAETVALNQGGFLIIEEGKTLTAIDVNTSAPDNHSRAARIRSDS